MNISLLGLFLVITGSMIVASAILVVAYFWIWMKYGTKITQWMMKEFISQL